MTNRQACVGAQRPSRRRLPVITLCVMASCVSASAVTAQRAPGPEALAARVDPYVQKQVMTDNADDPDDQMSMVRFLVYADQLDVEELTATTSTWTRRKVRPDVLQMLVAAYAEVRPRLMRHQRGFPQVEALKAVVVSGQSGYGMAAVGPDRMTPGAERIIRAAGPLGRHSPRPCCIHEGDGRRTGGSS